MKHRFKISLLYIYKNTFSNVIFKSVFPSLDIVNPHSPLRHYQLDFHLSLEGRCQLDFHFSLEGGFGSA